MPANFTPYAVQAGSGYTWSLGVQAASASGTITLSVQWRDARGTALGGPELLYSGTPTTSLVTQTGTTTAPATATQADLTLTYSGAAAYTGTAPVWLLMAQPAPGTVVAVDIADGSVTTAKVADGAVTTVKLATGAATTAVVADGAITTAKLADANVTAAKLAAAAVTSAKLAAQTAVPLTDATVVRGTLGAVAGGPTLTAVVNLIAALIASGTGSVMLTTAGGTVTFDAAGLLTLPGGLSAIAAACQMRELDLLNGAGDISGELDGGNSGPGLYGASGKSAFLGGDGGALEVAATGIVYLPGAHILTSKTNNDLRLAANNNTQALIIDHTTGTATFPGAISAPGGYMDVGSNYEISGQVVVDLNAGHTRVLSNDTLTLISDADGTPHTASLDGPSGTFTIPAGLEATGGYGNFGSNVQINGTPIVGAQGAAIPDINTLTGTLLQTQTTVNLILARMRAHGLIAT